MSFYQQILSGGIIYERMDQRGEVQVPEGSAGTPGTLQ
jgi:hypothetical protein